MPFGERVNSKRLSTCLRNLNPRQSILLINPKPSGHGSLIKFEGNCMRARAPGESFACLILRLQSSILVSGIAKTLIDEMIVEREIDFLSIPFLGLQFLC